VKGRGKNKIMKAKEGLLRQGEEEKEEGEGNNKD
jgi:hypothetical protein